MELRHLEYFVAVSEEQNFTRAAARLHIVQSAVSAAIKSLERELGASLLDRNSKRVLLTEAGRALLPRARVVLDAARDARDAVDDVRGGLRGTVRIGTLTSIKLIDLPGLLGEYHRRFPHVQLITGAAPSGTQGLLESVADGRLDLAFVSDSGRRPAGIDVRELASSVLDLVLPSDHPLAERESVTLHDIAPYDFIDSPIGFGNRAVADRAFADAGLQRRVSIEITDISTGVAYVRNGLGISLLPRFVLTERSGVVVTTVSEVDLTWPLAVATSSTRAPSAAVRALLGVLDEFLA
ncbi:LysR family transcriptional regulator [Rhodococcoides fascians]|uniref:LysR family transcriptional regulator n=1 Tax=Rhodococcoides fascians TaxID=1828 RepID=UPI00050C5AFC|nr:LysR family transcriptional regulator [Rhodococcus fascians]AMY53768.1 HTH-type transcriptional regulator GltC [Rhodococcus fascians D188]MBY4228001.1 LysR family transcriptional regulator [Rhodococcus fascians]CAH0140599.1 HTH-type transcriptional regulator GltC [Rhodococcus fascians]